MSNAVHQLVQKLSSSLHPLGFDVIQPLAIGW